MTPAWAFPAPRRGTLDGMTQTTPLTGTATFDPETGRVTFTAEGQWAPEPSPVVPPPVVKPPVVVVVETPPAETPPPPVTPPVVVPPPPPVVLPPAVLGIVTEPALTSDAYKAFLAQKWALPPSWGVGPWNTGNRTPKEGLKRFTAGTDLVEITRAGENLQGYYFPGGLSIKANNVRVDDFAVGWRRDGKSVLSIGDGTTGTRLSDGLIDSSDGRPVGKTSSIGLYAEEANDVRWDGLEILGSNDGFRFGGTGLRAYRTWVHHLVKQGTLHNDCAQTSNARDAVLDGFSFQAYSPATDYPGNACLMIGSERLSPAEIAAGGGVSLVVRNGYCDGGAVSINLGQGSDTGNGVGNGKPAALKSLLVERILFGPHTQHAKAALSMNRPGVTWREGTLFWAATKKSIPLSQVSA